MKEIRAFFKSTLGKLLLLVVVVVIGFGIREKLESIYEEQHQEVRKGKVTVYKDGSRAGRQLDYADNVPEDNKILLKFKEEFPEAEVIVACEDDLTNDGNKDLVVIFATLEDDEHAGQENNGEHKHVRLVAVVDSGDGENYEYTEPIPAPVENQTIKFQNVDKESQNEFILQGQKDNKVGYGIFRVVDGAVVNLFGEGMEEC